LYGLPVTIVRQISRTGQLRIAPKATKNVASSASAEPAKAKPAPGPM
jgi:hypothetical protein